MHRKIKIKWEIVITIIISIIGLYVSWQMYNIAKLQATIAKNSFLPNIVVTEKQKTDSKTENVIETNIEIKNTEGKLKNYESEVATVLQCEYLDQNNNFYCADIPVKNYYIVGMIGATNLGILEEKYTAGNYQKLKRLEDNVHKYNRNNDNMSLTFELKSYLKIEYVDFINEKEVLYYETDLFKTKSLEPKEGSQKFKYYEKLGNYDVGIDFNRGDALSVDELIGQICTVYDLEQNNKINGGNMVNIDNNVISVIAALLGAIVGAVCTYLINTVQQNRVDANRIRFNASILYNDLKSIEKYIKEGNTSVNLRYMEMWQTIVAECSFLNAQEIEYIYGLYDVAYNYNYSYRNKEKGNLNVKKDNISHYCELERFIFEKPDDSKYDERYEKLLMVLKRKFT